MPVKKSLEKLRSKKLLDALNEAYSEPEFQKEINLREKSKRYYKKKILRFVVANEDQTNY
jgi:hypothetical protein